MPTDELASLRASIERFETALARVETLGSRFESLEKAYRRQRIIIWVLSIAVVLLVALSTVTVVLMVNLKHNTDDDSKRAVAAALDACRIRNDSNAGTRRRFENFYKSLDALGQTDAFHSFVKSLRERDEAENPILDRDCNSNGIVGDVGDYGGSP